jgi:hypothetical protein
MKELAFLLLFIVSLSASAQRCKVTKDEVTGKTSVSSAIMIEGNPASSRSERTHLTLSKQDTARALSIVMITNAVTGEVKAENLSVMLKFWDGEIVKGSYHGNNQVSKRQPGTTFPIMIVAVMALSDDLVIKLQKKSLEKIRVVFLNDQGYDIMIKHADLIQKAADCSFN